MPRVTTMTLPHLRRLIRQHKASTVAELAVSVKVSTPTVYNWIRLFEMTPIQLFAKPRKSRFTSDKRAIQAFRLYSLRIRIADVAHIMGISQAMVRYYLQRFVGEFWHNKKYRVYQLPQPKTFAQIKVAKLLSAGYKCRDTIAQMTGVAQSTVDRYIDGVSNAK